MRTAALNTMESWTAPLSRAPGAAHGGAMAAIADIWQFWLDAEMDVTVILPPGARSCNQFPCGRNAIGRPLLELLDIETNPTAAVEFNTAFRAREPVRNLRFARAGEDGREVVFLISGAPLFDGAGGLEGYQCTVVDVSGALPAVACNAGDYEAILAAFIRHAPSMVVMKDVEGRFMAVNALAERAYGVSRSRLIGRHAREILAPGAAAECCKEDISVLASERTRETEQTFEALDGPRIFRTVKFPIFDADRYLVGTGAIGVEITAALPARNRKD